MAKRGILLIVLATLLIGCSKLNKENYDKLKVGMGYEEVVAILGKPDKDWNAKNVLGIFGEYKVVVYGE